ncbi:unnamed protein product [Rhizoctonia solani]|uniref:Uncharacterized protein n=1 Tax=Rhizoctonia solani TaxID=456999 RepID=A0A8H2WX09_9AGAM|nr:unnamed protein product [Rhizoctonia solani]
MDSLAPRAKVHRDGKWSEIDSTDLAIFDPPRDGTQQTIDDAIALGVKVKVVAGDQLVVEGLVMETMYLAIIYGVMSVPGAYRKM